MKVLMTVAFVASMFALVYAAPSDGDKSNHGCGCDQQKACSCEKDKCDCGNAESKCDCGTNCGGDKCDCGSKK